MGKIMQECRKGKLIWSKNPQKQNSCGDLQGERMGGWDDKWWQVNDNAIKSYDLL